MPVVLKVLLMVLKRVLWSFFGEKILAKGVWWFLEYASKKTTNSIDDDMVATAKAAYYRENK